MSLEVGESTVGASVRNAYRLVLAVHDGVRGSLGCSPDLPSRKLEDYLEGMDRLADALEGMGAARARVRGPSVRDPGVERPLDRFVTP